MLNNLTNFFNLIVGRRIKTALEDDDLIAVGTRQSSARGDYKPTAIKFEDLQSQLSGLQSVAVDNITIGGDGTLANPLYIIGGTSSVAYSNVIFVDRVNGNDSTGLINRFDKPFQNVNAAVTAASAFPGISTDNRALIYIRRGEYFNPILTLLNNVDTYCEAGVVFTGLVRIRDNGATVNSNVYGHLKIDAWTSTTMPLVITGPSTVTFEFDWISSQAAAMELNTTTTGGRITIKGNYIYSSTIGQGFGITIRNATNVSLNIANAIEVPHSVFAFRFYTGTTVINCPNIRLVSGNAYGGNFKQAIIVYDASSTGKITVNGDISNIDTINYGGIGSLVTLYGNSRPKLTINGNLYGGVTKALDGHTSYSGTECAVEINGNITSANQYTVWGYGFGQIVIKNSVITNTNGALGSFAVAVNDTAKIFFKDCYISNTFADTDVIVINGASTNLVIDGCALYSPGALGNSITSTAGAVTARCNNVRSNKALNANVTDLYSPSGYVLDANVITPISIN